MPRPSLSSDLKRICKQMEAFEASGSKANTGTGARREGAQFEHLIEELWLAFQRAAKEAGAQVEVVKGVGRLRYAKLTVQSRSMFVPTSKSDEVTDSSAEPSRWLEVAFGVSDLVQAYPTEAQAIHKYAPETGPYAGTQYPSIYSGLSTTFDDTVVMVDSGVLQEKILLEYKTAKSTAGHQIDGNAHERLSFQIMQYLEIATRYTKCSLTVIANGAFVRYRNKYHVNFHVQADRLTNFAWFSMDHACTQGEYVHLLDGLLAWLFEGTSRSARSRR